MLIGVKDSQSDLEKHYKTFCGLYYNHFYWCRWGQEALKLDRHHSGMDYVMLKALEADLKNQILFPITLKDLALWTSITPWSKISIREKRTICLLD